MASVSSKSYSGRVFTFTVTQSGTSTTLNWTFTVSGGSTNYYSTSAISCKIGGTTVYSCGATSWSSKAFPAAAGSRSGSLNVGSYGTYTITLSGNPWWSSASSYSSSVGMTKPTYAVTYNANGGSGAPGNQTKTYGTALTLSSTKPTRTDYDFVKWNTSADGSGTSYNPGDSYTGNAALTLYAIWTLAGHNITFNANGGAGAPATIFKNANATITIPATVPTRAGYDFLGWATSATGSAVYQPGDSYSTNAALSLYAVWDVSDPDGLQLSLVRNTRLVIYCEISPPTYGAGASLDYYVYTTNRGKLTYHGNNLLTVVLEEGSADQRDVEITLYAMDTKGQKSNTEVLIIKPRNCWRNFYGNQEVDDKIFYGDTMATLAARKEKIFWVNNDYQQTTYADMGQKTYAQLRIKGFN